MLARLHSLCAVVGAGAWIDIACLAVLILHIVVGYARGFSRMLASFTAMLLALQGGYWLYPSLSFYLGRLDIFKHHPTLTAISHYLLAVIIGLAVFLLLRLLLHRFFRLLVEQPVDHIFGAIVGTALGLMVLFFLFSVFSLLPPGNRIRKTVCESSRMGRAFTPVVRTVLDIRPKAVIRFSSDPAEKTLRKRKPSQPARKPVIKPSARRARGST